MKFGLFEGSCINMKPILFLPHSTSRNLCFIVKEAIPKINMCETVSVFVSMTACASFVGAAKNVSGCYCFNRANQIVPTKEVAPTDYPANHLKRQTRQNLFLVCPIQKR